MQRPDEAIEAFRRAVRIAPEDSSAWLGLGASYLAVENEGDALDVVKTLRRLDPEKADVLFNMIVPP